MSASASSLGAGRTRFALALALATLLAVVTRLPPSLERDYFNVDEGTLAAGAMLIDDGGIPYRDFWDTRGPVTFYLYAIAFALAGTGNMLAVHGLVIAVVIATAALLMLLGRRLGLGAAADLAGPVYALASVAFLKSDMLAANIEVFMVLFSAAGVLLVARGLAGAGVPASAAAGTAFALAFLTKQPALLTFLGVLGLLAALRGADAPAPAARLRAGAALVCGFALPVLAVVAAYAAVGALPDFYFGFWGYSSDYFMPAVDRLTRLRNAFLAPLPMIEWNPYAWLSALAGAGLLLIRLVRRGWRAAPADLLTVWALAALVGASLSGRGFGHYYIQVLPPFALLSTLFGAEVLARVRTAPRRVLLAGGMLLGYLLPLILWSGGRHPRAFHSAGEIMTERTAKFRITQAREAARHIEARTSPSDRIFVWGFAPAFYPLARRLPASRFIYCIYLTGLIPWTNAHPEVDTSATIVPGSWDLLMADLERTRPRYIIDTSPSDYFFWGKYRPYRFPRLRELLDRDYRLEKTVRSRTGGKLFKLYALIPAAEPPAARGR